MEMIVRRCVRCGRADTRRTWTTMDQAAEEGALRAWACSNCAWPEAELVEVEASEVGSEVGASAGPQARVANPDPAPHAVAGSRRDG